MGLPFTPDEILQQGQPVDAALVNSIQQAIATVTNTRRLTWRQARIPSGSTSASPVSDGDIQLGNPGDYLIELPVSEGEILRTVRMVGSTLAGATMTAELKYRPYSSGTPGQSPVQLGATQTWAPAGETETRKDIDLGAGVTIVLQSGAVDFGYWIYIVNAGSTGKIHTVKILVEERPALEAP